VTSPGPDDAVESHRYRLAPQVAVRLLGAGLVLVALVVIAATLLVALLPVPGVVLLVVVVLALGGLAGAAWWLRSRAWVLRLDDRGYVVRLVRGAGVTRARWDEVEEAVAALPQGRPCVVLHLRDGRTTTIPVEAVAGDREQLARDVRARLRQGGVRP